MAMKKCKECGEEVSSSAKVCPKCGKDQRNFFMKHKVITFILAIVILGAIGSTMGDNNTQQTSVTTSNNGNNTVQSNSVQNSQELIEEGDIGNYHVKIVGNKVTKDYSGNPILLVTVNFTNNSDEAKSFLYNLDCKAYQNGVELTSPISSYGINEYNWEDKSKEIKSGVSYEFNLAFELSDTTTDVEVEITTPILSKYSSKVIKTINLK